MWRPAPNEPKFRLTDMRQWSRNLIPQRQSQRAFRVEWAQLTSWMGKTSVHNKSLHIWGMNSADKVNFSRMTNNAALVEGKRRRSKNSVALLKSLEIRKFDNASDFKSRDESPIILDRCTSDSLVGLAEATRLPPGFKKRNKRKKHRPKYLILQEGGAEDQHMIIPRLLNFNMQSKVDQKPQQNSKPTQSLLLPPQNLQNYQQLPPTKQCSQHGNKYKRHRDFSYQRDFFNKISSDAEAAPYNAIRNNPELHCEGQRQVSPKQVMIFKPTAATNSDNIFLEKLQKDVALSSDELKAVCGNQLCSTFIPTEKKVTGRLRPDWNSNRDGRRDFADLHHQVQKLHNQVTKPLLPQQPLQTSKFETESLWSPSTESIQQPCGPSTQPLTEKQPDQHGSLPSKTQSPPTSESVPLLSSSQSYLKQTPQLQPQSRSEPLPKHQPPTCPTINSRQETLPTTEKQTPTFDNNNSLESESPTVKFQCEHMVGGLTSFLQSQEQLCTSSSNCCGGSKRNKSKDLSLESSLNIMSGTSVLSRPGSLHCINIDGLEARRLRCAHEIIKNGDMVCKDNNEYKENIRRMPEPHTSKKRVSFSSACTNRNENDKTDCQVTSIATCTSAVSMETIQEDFSFDFFKTDTDVSELDSDTRELSSIQSANVRTHSKVTTKIPDVYISPTLHPIALPPPVPPHAIGSQILSSRILNKNSTQISQSKLTKSILTDRTSQRFLADRTSIVCTFDAQLTDNSDDLGTGFVSDGAFGATKTNPKSQEVASNLSGTSNCNWKSSRTETSSQQSQISGAKKENEPKSAGFGFLHKKPEGDKRYIQIEVRQLNPKNNSGHFQNPTDTKTISSQLRSHTGGSNCANSSIGLRRHVDQNHNRRCHKHDPTDHWHHRHGPVVGAANQNPVVNALACTGDQIFKHPSMPPIPTKRNESGNVVFNHPPEVSTAAKSSTCCASLRDSSARLDELPEENCSESIAFSWVTNLDTDSNAVDLSVSLNGSSLQPQMASRRNNSAGCSKHYSDIGKVKFNQLNTTEGCLTSIRTAAPTNARIADVTSTESILKPSAVLDSATMYSVAKCVTQSESSDQAGSYESTQSDSDQPFLMLETVSCGHKDFEHNKCSISCRSYTPPNLRQNSRASAPAKFQPAAAARHQNSSSMLSTFAPPPFRQDKSKNSPLAPLSASTSAVSQVSAAADAVRDLLARACEDPAEATALTQALVRGLICNVESLRSALAATLLLLKDRRGTTGPLSKAIGTAKALDELIRQFQDSQQLQQQQQKEQKNVKRINQKTTSSEEDSYLLLEKASAMKAGLVGKTLKQSTAPRRISRNSLSRYSAASQETLQCHTMAHYTVGDEFVIPSLVQHSNLECRPATTRVVRTESKAVNLPSSKKRWGP